MGFSKVRLQGRGGQAQISVVLRGQKSKLLGKKEITKEAASMHQLSVCIVLTYTQDVYRICRSSLRLVRLNISENPS